MKKSLFFGLCIAMSTAVQAQMNEADRFVEALLRKMTLEEKVGQMNQYNGFWEVTGPAPNHGDAKVKYDHLRKGMVGAVLNVRGVKNVRALQDIAVKESRLGIPLLFGFDVIHGYKTIFPIPLGEAASWDLALMESTAAIAAKEAAAAGINWTFAPMMDVSRDARWGRVMEGAGEDTYLGTAIGLARIKGFQGEQFKSPFSIAATAKHFAGYGFAEAGKDYNTVDIGTNTLHNIVLPPFKAAAEAGVATFMNSFNVLNGIPATGNRWLQRDVLKGQWKYKGFIVSDWGSAKEMIDHGFAANLTEAAAIAANAGSDMDMESHAYVAHLVALVKSGKVKESVVNDAARRILLLKYQLGLFTDPYRFCDEAREQTWLLHPTHQQKALEAAQRSMVLLKNENELLPLQKGQRLALIGALANDNNSILGSWRIGSDDSSAVTVLAGMQQYVPNIAYAPGPSVTHHPTAFIKEVMVNQTDTSGMAAAVATAAAADVVVMVLGEHGFQSGEGRSRTQLDLPGLQQQLLEAVYKVNQRIVLVLLNGRPLTIPWAAQHIPAIITAWQPGTQGGNAIADVLFGTYNPSGKLPMSFPRSVGQLPIYYNHYRTGRPQPKEEVFWTHYIDEANSPLYPFGFGLSYTQFQYSSITVSKDPKQGYSAQVTVTNTGKRNGEEVVQFYVTDRFAGVVRPVKELRGFQKIMLAPGQSKVVRFPINRAALGFYDASGNWVVEPGDFDLMIGTNSNEGKSILFQLQQVAEIGN